jgi:hypothetical protein
MGYIASGQTAEELHEMLRQHRGTPIAQPPPYAPPPSSHNAPEKAVLVTGPAQSGRWPMKIQWRDEAAATEPERWKDLESGSPSQPVTGWAVPFNSGESLDQGKRYKGMLVSVHTDGKAVFACVVGGGGEPGAVVQVTSTRVGVYYRAFKGTGFNEATRTFQSKVEILVLDAADIGFPP